MKKLFQKLTSQHHYFIFQCQISCAPLKSRFPVNTEYILSVECEKQPSNIKLFTRIILHGEAYSTVETRIDTFLTEVRQTCCESHFLAATGHCESMTS